MLAYYNKLLDNKLSSFLLQPPLLVNTEEIVLPAHSRGCQETFSFASTQPREKGEICAENDREWSDFSIYLALPLEHCLSAVGASLREAAKISVCRKIVGTNVFSEDILFGSLSVCLQFPPLQSSFFTNCRNQCIAYSLNLILPTSS